MSNIKVVAVSFEKQFLIDFDNYLKENNLGHRSTFLQNAMKRIIYRKKHVIKPRNI